MTHFASMLERMGASPDRYASSGEFKKLVKSGDESQVGQDTNCPQLQLV